MVREVYEPFYTIIVHENGLTIGPTTARQVEWRVEREKDVVWIVDFSGIPF